MPIYTYICQACKEKFDLLIGVNQTKSELACVKCGTLSIKRNFGGFAIAGGGSCGGNCAGSCGSCSGGNCSSCSH